ncbi:MAG: 16S rRNA (guanine(966)-N(2))-methyltransferase RsmD [Parachlamydiales bacterium]|nr:16S rRNA (guanine(966)-N(2))-methyltransferase RsmD [Candidatus Acheromyda pituitae]
MSLRIIGGTFRNRLLKTPKGPQTRPSLAILRKAVFDILQQEIVDAEFLDLFAGAGAMGLEAISRGAKQATFIDKDRYALRCINENIKSFHVEDQCELFAADVFVALEKLGKAGRKFDVVYIDPPYAASAEKSLIPKILSLLESLDLLKPQAIVFAEEGAPPQLKLEQLEHLKLHLVNSRQFSQSVLHQLRT